MNIEKVIELLNVETDKRPPKKIDGTDLNVENLKFTYEGNDSFALDGISFSVTMTIRGNLLLAKADATEAGLIDCCRRASIYDFTQTLQNKLDTIIGEKGVKFGSKRWRDVSFRYP